MSLALLFFTCAPLAQAQDPAPEPTAPEPTAPEPTAPEPDPEPAAKEPAPKKARRVKGKVRFLTEHILYLDTGSDAGVAVDDVVLLRLSNGVEAKLPIEASSRRTSTAALGPDMARLVRVGQPLVILATGKRAATRRKPRTGATRRKPTARPSKKKKPKARPNVDDIWKDAAPVEGDTKSSGPLLAPVATQEGSQSRREKDKFLLSGRLTLSANHAKDQFTGQEWSRVRAHGRIILDRLGGTDWRAVMRLSANDLFENGDDDPQFRVHELFLEHAPKSRSHVLRLGRFYFDPLPTVGQLDGVHGEIRAGSSPFYFGAAAGMMPVPTSEAFDNRRAAATLYSAYRNLVGEVADVDLTLGYLATSFEDSLDRSAVLANQRIALFQTVYLNAHQVVDIYDSKDRNNGTRLTQTHLDLSVRPNEWLTIGGGYNRNEVPDTHYGLDLYPDLSRLRNTRSQRFYGRATQKLSRGWSLNERISFIDRFTDDLQVGVALSAFKTGLFSELDSLQLGFNGLYGGKVDEHSPYLDLTKNIIPGLDLKAGYRLRVIQPLRGDDTFVQHELHGGGSWIWSSFSLDLDASYTLGDDVELVRLFAAVTWWF